MTRLRPTELSYADGGEESVLALLRAATDLSSLSDELAVVGTTWAEIYHLAPARANVLRALQLPPDAAVLEVGAGCGAITRYLGETCAMVDSLEPVSSRALAARERTRDLTTVEIFIGELGDVPAVPAYDVVVVVGVLEYVGFGEPDLAPYQEFLAQVRQVLKPGGSLVLAIENQLGVKYLVGAPEDHTDRPFDSIEGYPHGGRARTFSRSALHALLEGADLHPRFLGAFPDYKMTRTVLDPSRLTGEHEALLHRIPRFPSPDWGTPRLPLADELLAWRTLIGAGLAAETPNSFLVVAGATGPSPLWAASDAAVYYSVARRARCAVETRVDVSDPQTPWFRRRRLRDEVQPANIWLELHDAPFSPGRDFIDVFVDTDDPTSMSLLDAWRSLVVSQRAAPGRADRPVSLDVVPHNLVVAPDGTLVAIDEEWRSKDLSVDDVLLRGPLTLTTRLAAAGDLAGRWAGCTTLRDVALRIGAAVGLLDGGWLRQAVHNEARLQAIISAGTSGESVGALEAELHATLAQPLRLQQRLDAGTAARVVLLEGERRQQEAFIDHLHRDIADLKAYANRLEAEREARPADLREPRARGRWRFPRSG